MSNIKYIFIGLLYAVSVEATPQDAKHCLSKVDGSLACWNSPFAPPQLKPIRSLSTTQTWSCSIDVDDQLECWGIESSLVVVKQGYVSEVELDARKLTPRNLGPVDSVTVSHGKACVIKRDRSLFCFGKDHDGETKIPPDLGRVESVSIGWFHICVKLNDGTGRCWGSNNFGQLDIPSDLGPVLAIHAGPDRTCVIKPDNLMKCWGCKYPYMDDWRGHCGDHSAIGPVLSLSLAYLYTCVVTAKKMGHCWPGNNEGRVPPMLGTIDSIEALGSNTCAVRTSGERVCWDAKSEFSDDAAQPVIDVEERRRKLSRLRAEQPQVSAGFGPGMMVVTSIVVAASFVVVFVIVKRSAGYVFGRMAPVAHPPLIVHAVAPGRHLALVQGVHAAPAA